MGRPGGFQAPPRKSRAGLWWLIGGLAAFLVVALLIGWAVRGVLHRAGIGGDNPGGEASAQLCPVDNNPGYTPPPHPSDGRVHGGALSFPLQPPPWDAPVPDDRVPFGRDVQVQQAMVHQSYQGANSWVASLLVGELMAGDGFFTPQQGSEIVVKCVVGTFYGGAEVTRDDKVNKATKVGGKDAWIVESHLSFDIPNLPTKGELLILVIVATGDASASLYYASIPDDSPQYVQPARDCLKQLKVG